MVLVGDFDNVLASDLFGKHLLSELSFSVAFSVTDVEIDEDRGVPGGVNASMICSLGSMTTLGIASLVLSLGEFLI
jgi:hypothetical protein